MNLQESIIRILREETEVPAFLRRRFSPEDLDWLVNDVKELIDYGESLDTAIYDGVREFVKSRKFSDIDEFGPDADYWESYLRYEKPLVDYVKKKLRMMDGVNESILSENRQERILLNYLNEYGIYETSKITGLSMTKIIEISNFPINPTIANELLLENLGKGKLKDTYKGFNIQSTLDGVVYWDGELKTGEFLPNYTEVITAMATPFWDGLDYTPVEIDWITLMDRSREIGEQIVFEIEGGGNYFKVLKDKKIFDSVEELFSWYDEVYLPGVYDIIINKLLPIAQQDMEDKMYEDMIF